MTLTPGTTVGPYKVLAPLGAGGMGEVYRAHDSRLGRDVAIKLLPDAFASDPERLARFEREAKLLASLQHANIAVLHGLEESGGRRFLVMQCVEGESLAQRLARGPLPPAEALEIAGAIAAGLEAAHESGIVHRDLKPGNVMVTPTGEVKVLDFGLARGGAGASSSGEALSASPTLTFAATHAGVILGTAAYMSPEQARGKPVDRRTDIWSFGCVLFECLTGRQAFAGETVSDIVARILQTEPDWSALPESTPGRVRDLLVRCLQKDARRRLRDIGDARIEIEDLVAGRVSASGAHLALPVTVAPRRPWLVPAMVGFVVLTVLATWFVARTLAPSSVLQPIRFVVEAPRGQTLPEDALCSELSPDGRTLAVIAADSSGVSRIWIRAMDSLLPRPLPGTENTTMMFWSPDSRLLAFCANDRQLLRVAIAGGDPELICEIKVARGGSWNRDGVILIAPYSNGAIYRVPANGGDLVPVVRPDSARGETALRFPQFLPDGRHFLYSSLSSESDGKHRVCVASLDGGAPRTVLRAESGAFYAEPGWLLYARRDAVVAQRFAPGTQKLEGDPVALGDAATGSGTVGSPRVSASRAGTLAYVTLDPVASRLAWLDIQGRETATVPAPSGFYGRVVLSPDERRALLGVSVKGQSSYVALADLDRGIITRVTPLDLPADYQAWSPDGRAFAYVDVSKQTVMIRSLTDDSLRVYLATDPAFKQNLCWTADGRFILYDRLDSATKWDIWALPLDGSGPARPVLHSAASELHPTLSPDGRWLAYESDESGLSEVYVLPFGAGGMPYQVTNGGGFWPYWTKDGKGLIFSAPRDPNALVEVDIRPGTTFAAGPPRPLGRVPGNTAGADFDRATKRIIALVPAEKARPQTITVVQNWQAALKKP
jgi:Tol biopolymer transport system component